MPTRWTSEPPTDDGEYLYWSGGMLAVMSVYGLSTKYYCVNSREQKTSRWSAFGSEFRSVEPVTYPAAYYATASLPPEDCEG